jgi:geranylgeranylglycerol-phosphate geranylgeranyltransferase
MSSSASSTSLAVSFKAWLRLARIEHAFIAAFAVVAAQAFVTKRFDAAFLFPAIAPFLITAASFVLNDYYDFKSDKALRRKDRPLVNGAISRKHALYAAGALYALGIAFAALLPLLAFAIAFVYAAASVAYSSWLKRLPFVGNVFIASSMAVSFIYGGFAVSVSPNGALNYLIVLFALMSFFMGLGREFLITLRDVVGDKKIGARTLPMLIGAKRTVIAANALIYLGVVLSFIPFFALPSLFLPYAALIVVADALLVATVLKTSLSHEKESLRFARNASLAAMLIGTLAFATLAFA